MSTHQDTLLFLCGIDRINQPTVRYTQIEPALQCIFGSNSLHLPDLNSRYAKSNIISNSQRKGFTHKPFRASFLR